MRSLQVPDGNPTFKDPQHIVLKTKSTLSATSLVMTCSFYSALCTTTSSFCSEYSTGESDLQPTAHHDCNGILIQINKIYSI